MSRRTTAGRRRTGADRRRFAAGVHGTLEEAGRVVHHIERRQRLHAALRCDRADPHAAAAAAAVSAGRWPPDTVITRF